MSHRSVCAEIPRATLTLPALPRALVHDCAREIKERLALEPGDVEELSLARARLRWPGYRLYVQAAQDWLSQHHLPATLANCPVALMACRGARVHHDAQQYGDKAFCNLFLSPATDLYLHFPFANNTSIALTHGSIVVFDTAQPHMVSNGADTPFKAEDFANKPNSTALFLSWELPIGILANHAESARLAIAHGRLLADGEPLAFA